MDEADDTDDANDTNDKEDYSLNLEIRGKVTKVRHGWSYYYYYLNDL